MGKCGFTLAHYREILESALQRNCRFAGFHEELPQNVGPLVYLRHDIDVSLSRALRMARLENELQIRATYFVLHNSPFYNLLDDRSMMTVKRLVSLGHWIGLHIDYDHRNLERKPVIEDYIRILFNTFRAFLPLVPVVSFHRPVPELLNKRMSSVISTYEPRFFSSIKYISDSRRQWAKDCACRLFTSGQTESIQLLIHPVWWDSENTADLQNLGETLIEERKQELRAYLMHNITPFQISLQSGKSGG